MESAMEFLKPRGELIIAGNLAGGEKIEIDPFELIGGKTIRGTWGGNTDNPDGDIPYYAEELNIFSILQGNDYKLEQINEAVDNFREGKEIRPIICL